jgi:hypothetical protein
MSYDSQTFSHIFTYHDHIQHEKKFVNMLAIVWLLVKKKLHSIYSKTYNFWDLLSLNGVNTLLSNTVKAVKCAVRCPQETQCIAGLRCDQVIMECTYGEYYKMLLTFSDCTSWDDTDARKYTLCYCGWYNSETNISMTAAPFLRNMKCYTYIRHFWMQTAWIRANQDTIIAALKRELWKTHVIWHKNWNYSKHILEVLLDSYWIHITTCGKQLCLQVIILYTYYTCKAFHLIPCANWWLTHILKINVLEDMLYDIFLLTFQQRITIQRACEQISFHSVPPLP